jgi:hypothetical protein
MVLQFIAALSFLTKVFKIHRMDSIAAVAKIRFKTTLIWLVKYFHSLKVLLVCSSIVIWVSSFVDIILF